SRLSVAETGTSYTLPSRCTRKRSRSSFSSSCSSSMRWFTGGTLPCRDMADEPEETVAWQAMRYKCPVLGADGNTIGEAMSLLGDESADIFHGIAVLHHALGRLLEVPAASI